MIEVRELSKRFGSTVAVDQLSFSVRPGSVTGFLGPNGSGKSTTMRMILGLDRPSGGSTTVNGRPYGEIRRPLHEVGALLDAKAMHGGRSAYHHLLCVAQSNGIPPRRVGEVLDLVGLRAVARKRARTFSLGMGQRLGIATALLGDPEVLLFDEPINGLDPEGILWIRTLLRGLAGEGRTVFVSSHLMSEMALTADHLVVIGRGRLIADSSTADLIARSSQGFVHVRTPDADGLPSVLRVAGAAVHAEAGSLRVTGL
ncbi:MAG: type transport system ATP-binding protein, partial [Actinomycetota bacterium]|nr:type transport system ATP-binding protein [Actinomycetota bacterium]